MKDGENKHSGGGFALWGALILVVILIVVVALLIKFKPDEKVEEIEEKASPIATRVIEPVTIPDHVRIPGRVEALVDATLSTEKPGRVVELKVDKGDAVTKGQLLLQLDDRIWQTALERAGIELREAKKDWERWKGLEKVGAVSGSEFDNVRTRKDQAEVAHREAEVMVEQCRVQSPVDGIVVDRYVEEGEYAGEGVPVFTVVDISRVKIAISVPERSITAVQPGEEAVFSISALDGRSFTGKVSFVSARANPASNAFDAEILADNPDSALHAGMIADVYLQRGSLEDAIVVPMAAVVPQKGDHVVFLEQDGRAVRQVVYLGVRVGRDVVIKNGLEAGDRLIVEGQRTLVDGMKVEEAVSVSAAASAAANADTAVTEE
jgi:membrane fusion protein (multidrug efflux system)